MAPATNKETGESLHLSLKIDINSAARNCTGPFCLFLVDTSNSNHHAQATHKPLRSILAHPCDVVCVVEGGNEVVNKGHKPNGSDALCNAFHSLLSECTERAPCKPHRSLADMNER